MPLDPIYLSNVAAGTGGFVIYGRNQADRAGASVASAGDFNGDGFDDLIIGAPYAGQVSNATPLGGEVYVLFGQSGGFSPSILLSAIAAGTGGFVIFGEDAGDQAGRSVASAGDINGDGFDDLIIGASSADSTGNAAGDAGDIYVVFGSASGFTTGIDLSSIAAGSGGFVLHGQDVNDHAGFSVASAGDINGDGLGDLLIGAYGGDTVGFSRPTAGDTYVVFGKTPGFGASIDLSTIAAGTGGFVVYGQDIGDRSGTSVASAGDVNGDGFDDLLIGAFYGDGPGNSRSATGDTYVVFGKASGFAAVLDLSTIAAGTGGFVIYGVDAADASGFSVASAGDVNSDGVDDLLIGARRAAGAGNAEFFAGEAYVVFGKTTGFDPSIDLSAVAAGTGGFVIHGQDADDWAGFSVASAGDINGDGFDDLLIGAPYSDAPSVLNSGDSFVVFGKSSGFGAAIDLGTIAAGTGGFIIRGQDDDDQSGRAVAAAGDVDGDGFDDIIIGAPTADGVTNTRNGTGESYVIFGRDFTGTVTKAGTAASETLTGSAGVDDIVAGVGDDILDGLGGVDVLLGGAGDDTIKVADLTFQRVDGGTGTDTLALSGAGTSLDLSTIATTRLRNIEVIDLTGAGDNTLILSARAVLALSGSTNTLKVSGNAGDVLSFGAETWIHTGTAGGYATFTSGQAVVTFSTDLTVTKNPVDLVAIAAGTGGFVIFGQDGDDLSGTSVASAGDINGDGYDDLIIGARGAGATNNARAVAGESYVVFGKSGGFGAGIELSAIAAGIGGFVIFGQDDTDASGASVASAGDINGDGFADLIIGAPGTDGSENAKDGAGGSYVVFGKASAFGASIELDSIAAGTGGFVIFGQDDLDNAGGSVASAGDINGDGLDDLIIGASGGDGAGNTTSGAGDTYVVFGKTGGFGIGIDLGTIAAGTGGFVIHGQDVYDGSGRSVASAGDINGDGLADLIIGAANAESVSNARGTAGEAYVVFGKSDGFDPSTELSTIAAGTGGFIISGQWPSLLSGQSPNKFNWL